MATLSVGGSLVTTNDTLSNGVQDNITRLGTITSGTASAINDTVKLYSNAFSGVTTVSIDGYFDDTKYAYYEASFLNIQNSAAAQCYIRLNTGGAADTSAVYWSALSESHTISGTGGVADRADNDGATFTNVDGTWNGPQDTTDATQNIKIIIASPQSTSNFKLCRIESVSAGQGTSTVYNMCDTGVFTFRSTTAVTGLTFLLSATSNTQGRALLYGIKL